MNELMSGVEILSSTEVVIETTFSASNCIIVFFCCLAFSLIAGLVIGFADDQIGLSLLAGMIVGIVFGLSLGGFVGVYLGEPVAYETQYKVIIDDSVSMNEFLYSYEIINTEGKIYTVRVRTESDLDS